MRVPGLAVLVLFASASVGFAAQQPAASLSAQRDPQAVALLQRSLAAMGGGVPSDCVVSGRVTIVAGSDTSTGSIRILARGFDQIAEQIETAGQSRSEVYSQQSGTISIDGAPDSMPLETAVSAQPVDVPLFAVAAVLSNPDFSVRVVGREVIGAIDVYHLQTANTFASKPGFGRFASMAARDLWIDATSYLPLRISYSVRTVRSGEVPDVIEVSFSDYRTVGGLQFPYLIRKSLNGTPWTTIQVEQVAMNTGLSDADFPQVER